MPHFVIRLTEMEVLNHAATVREAMTLLSKTRPSVETVQTIERLQRLEELLRRGLEDEGPSPLVDVCQRPKVRQILGPEGDEREEALTPWERDR